MSDPIRRLAEAECSVKELKYKNAILEFALREAEESCMFDTGCCGGNENCDEQCNFEKRCLDCRIKLGKEKAEERIKEL